MEPLIHGLLGAFRFRVLVGLKGISAHTRSKETAQTILGSSCAQVEIADDGALNDPMTSVSSSWPYGLSTLTLFLMRRLW